MVIRGGVWPGLGTEGNGMALYGIGWDSTVRSGMVRSGTVWCGVAWCVMSVFARHACTRMHVYVSKHVYVQSPHVYMCLHHMHVC